MNVKKFNKEIPRCTLSGSTELYRLKCKDFLLVLIIRYLPNKSRLPYGHGVVNQELLPHDTNGYSLSNQLYFIQIKESLGMCLFKFVELGGHWEMKNL